MLIDDLKAEAAAQVSKYPQYASAFDSGWGVATVKRTFSTKMGEAGTQGQKVLVRTDEGGEVISGKSEGSRYPNAVWVSFWSRNNGVETSARLRDFVIN